MMIPIDLMLQVYNGYAELATNIFNYMNGKINEENYCRLVISTYDMHNFAEFRKPNTVIIYLGNIISTYYPEDLKVKSVILMTIAHELSHAVQDTNMVKYGYDPYYQSMVEQTNEARAEKWVKDHMREIHKLFGFRLKFSKEAINVIMPKAVNYEQFSIKNHYLYTLVDVVYRDKKYIPPLTELMDKDDNLLFSINDSKVIPIKRDGQFLYDSVYEFNIIIDHYCRKTIVVKNFTVQLTITKVETECKNGYGTWIRLFITNARYNPVIGIKE